MRADSCASYVRSASGSGNNNDSGMTSHTKEKGAIDRRRYLGRSVLSLWARNALVLFACVVLLPACGGHATSPDSASTSPSATPPPARDTVAPSTPSGVNAVALSGFAVQISWRASSDDVGVAGYRIFQDGSFIGTTGATSFGVSGLVPGTTYSFAVAAYDAAGNMSALSAVASVTTPSAVGNVYHGDPTNYQQLLANLQPGDTLMLAAGTYDNAASPGLPVFGLHGTAAKPIVISGPASGPRAVLLGRSTHNTVRIADSSYVTIRNLEIDGRDLGGDGVKAQGTAHHITLENLLIHGVGDDQQTVGISTNGGTTWGWIIRRNTIIGAGTGMYLGSSDGGFPFIAGLIEHNLLRDTIGYNIEIKHQNTRPALAGMPTGNSSTVIRHNVLSKSTNSSSGALARPNLLVGHFPPSGTGADDLYEIYGNFFYQNPSEALFQGEGNIALHHNLLVNDFGDAINIQPHNDIPKMVRVFHNTIVAAATGIRVTGGSSAFTQIVIGNAVFAATPISAADQRQNITDTYANAVNYLVNPFAAVGQLDLFPRRGVLGGSSIDVSVFNTLQDWDRDFNGAAQDEVRRGAYSGEGTNPGWLPKLEIKPAS